MTVAELMRHNFDEIFIELDPVKRGGMMRTAYTEDCVWIHHDQADSTSQALDWVKQYPSVWPMEEYQRRQLLRLKLNLPVEYVFKQCDEDELIIAEHFLTGERICWNGGDWEQYA